MIYQFAPVPYRDLFVMYRLRAFRRVLLWLALLALFLRRYKPYSGGGGWIVVHHQGKRKSPWAGLSLRFRIYSMEVSNVDSITISYTQTVFPCILLYRTRHRAHFCARRCFYQQGYNLACMRLIASSTLPSFASNRPITKGFAAQSLLIKSADARPVRRYHKSGSAILYAASTP